MDVSDLQRMIEEHAAWFQNAQSGRRLELRDVDLRGVELTGVRLSGAAFERVNFEGAVLRGARLNRTTMTDVSFARADLDGASFEDSRLTRVDYAHAHMPGASVSYVQAEDCDLSGVRLDSGFLVKGVFAATRFTSASLRGTNLRRLTATASSFAGCDLTAASLTSVTLTDVDLRGALLDETTLVKVLFNRARVFGVRGPAALLQDCGAVDADFSEAGDGSAIGSERELFDALEKP